MILQEDKLPMRDPSSVIRDAIVPDSCCCVLDIVSVKLFHGSHPYAKDHRDFSFAASRLARNDTVEERFPTRHFEEPIRATWQTPRKNR